MTSDDHPQAEFLRNQLFDTTSHYSCRFPIAKQLDDPCRQAVGGVRWYKEAAPAVADHLAAAWHVRRHDREPG
jgi:hypothetical protein